MTPTIELICGHRSIRHFTDEPISEAQREAIINSARATSSSSFLQCSSIIRITDKALREELVTLTGGQEHVAQAAEFWVFCADFNRHLQICPDAQLGLAEYYLTRGSNNRRDTWSDHIRRTIIKESRPFILDYLHKQGWATR
ncbi:nitroreductase family protein [Escherichia coli]|nr:nitroreductase family protein [Escherichia coli]